MTNRKEEQGTSGWIIFASTMIVIGSLSHFSIGLTYVFNTPWALLNTSYTSETTVRVLGLLQLGVGLLMVVSAWGVLSAKTWARAVGILFGVVTIVEGIGTIQLYPGIGLFVVLIGVGIIFALTAKGTVVAREQVPMGEEGAPIAGRTGPLEGELPSEQYAEEDRRAEDI